MCPGGRSAVGAAAGAWGCRRCRCREVVSRSFQTITRNHRPARLATTAVMRLSGHRHLVRSGHAESQRQLIGQAALSHRATPRLPSPDLAGAPYGTDAAGRWSSRDRSRSGLPGTGPVESSTGAPVKAFIQAVSAVLQAALDAERGQGRAGQLSVDVLRSGPARPVAARRPRGGREALSVRYQPAGGREKRVRMPTSRPSHPAYRVTAYPIRAIHRCWL
jgi:hypothetical protein